MKYIWNNSIEKTIENLGNIDGYKVKIKKNNNRTFFTMKRKYFLNSSTILSRPTRIPISVIGVGELIANHDKTTTCNLSYRYRFSFFEMFVFILLSFLILLYSKEKYGVDYYVVIVTLIAITILTIGVTYLASKYSKLGLNEVEKIEQRLEYFNIPSK